MLLILESNQEKRVSENRAEVVSFPIRMNHILNLFNEGLIEIRCLGAGQIYSV